MTQNSDIQKLTAYIEENTRASATSGISYIDPQNLRHRVTLRQNHIIFGRRGAGKSSLIKTVKDISAKKYLYAYINLEDIKDVSFPNILIHVLNTFESDIIKQLKNDTKFYQLGRKRKVKKVVKVLRNAITHFKNEIPDPDKSEEDYKSKQGFSTSVNASVKIEPISVGAEMKETGELEIAKKVYKDKLESLKNAIPSLKQAIKYVSEEFPEKPIFLILDDFYFLKKQVQIFFIDFFHRLTKDTHLYLKVASIRHRSKIYSKLEHSHYGTEIGHDIYEIDLDYNLNRFEELKDFMRALINQCANSCKVTFDINDIFSPGAFTQICLASGGVPRDFLTLFVKVSNNYDESKKKKISKTNITEAAILNMSNKSSSMGIDSSDEKDILEAYLSFIKDKILNEKRTNMFLVSNGEIDKHSQARQAIKELIDLRMIHLVESDTSASGGKKGGHRYSAYIIDVGFYPSAVISGFTQKEPGITDDAGRKDAMRSSPILDIDNLNSFIISKNFDKKLEISEE